MMDFYEMVKQVCGEVKPLLSLVTTVLWGIYVFFTIRTFKEIKKQTDIQSVALLVIQAEIGDVPPGRSRRRRMIPCIDDINEKQLELHRKWTSIVETNIPDAVQEEQSVYLRLSNRGSADIISWQIDVSMEVESGKYLTDKSNISGEKFSWTVESLRNSAKHIIAKEKEITICIAKTGSFPSASWNWTVSFEDMRGKKYTNYTGDNNASSRNRLALEKTEESGS